MKPKCSITPHMTSHVNISGWENAKKLLLWRRSVVQLNKLNRMNIPDFIQHRAIVKCPCRSVSLCTWRSSRHRPDTCPPRIRVCLL
jgi:hypothetical protein